MIDIKVHKSLAACQATLEGMVRNCLPFLGFLLSIWKLAATFNIYITINQFICLITYITGWLRNLISHSLA